MDAIIAFKLIEGTTFFDVGLASAIMKSLTGRGSELKVTASHLFEMELETHDVLALPAAILFSFLFLIVMTLVAIFVERKCIERYRSSKKKFKVIPRSLIWARKFKRLVKWDAFDRLLLIGASALLYCSFM